MTVAELEAAVPGIKFTNYLSALLPRPVTDQESVLMFALPYFNKLTDLVEETDKRWGVEWWELAKHSTGFKVCTKNLLFSELYPTTFCGDSYGTDSTIWTVGSAARSTWCTSGCTGERYRRLGRTFVSSTSKATLEPPSGQCLSRDISTGRAKTM